ASIASRTRCSTGCARAPAGSATRAMPAGRTAAGAITAGWTTKARRPCSAELIGARLAPGPVEPGKHRLEVLPLPRFAAAEPEAGRRIAIARDVERDPFALEQPRHLLHDCGARLGVAGDERRRDDLEADRGAGAGGRILGEKVDPVGAR